MSLSQADIIISNNPKAYGIVYADQIAGHRSVKSLTDLYAIADCILSKSGDNADDDAIGQEWFVSEENQSYRLADWDKRGSAAGWAAVASPAAVPAATATASTLDAGSEATASVAIDVDGYKFSFGIPKGEKGEKGETGEKGADGKDGVTPSITATATVDGSSGNPSVTVTKSGTDEAPNFEFAFTGLKGADGEGGSSDVTLPATIVTSIGSVDNFELSSGVWEIYPDSLHIEIGGSYQQYDTSTNTTTTKRYGIIGSIPGATTTGAGVMSATHYNVVDSIINVGSETGVNRMVIPSVVNSGYSYEYNDGVMQVSSDIEGYAFNAETGKFEAVNGSAISVYPTIPAATTTTGGIMSPDDKTALDSLNTALESLVSHMTVATFTTGYVELTSLVEGSPLYGTPTFVKYNDEYCIIDYYSGKWYAASGKYENYPVGSLVKVAGMDLATGRVSGTYKVTESSAAMVKLEKVEDEKAAALQGLWDAIQSK